jgi:hypothetical protein
MQLDGRRLAALKHLRPTLADQAHRACHHFILHPRRADALELLEIEPRATKVTFAVCLHLRNGAGDTDRGHMLKARTTPSYMGARHVVFALRDRRGLTDDTKIKDLG